MFKQLANKRSLMGLLYAFVLGIPLLSVLVRTCYVTFNKNAYQSYSGSNGYSIQYKYETNEVNSVDDLVEGNIYTFDFTNLDYSQFTGTTRFVLTNGVRFHYKNDNLEGDFTFDVLGDKGIYITMSNNTHFYFRYENNYNGYVYNLQISYVIDNKIDFIYKGNMTSDYISYITQSNYNEIESVEISNNGTLDNAFEYSLQKVTQNNNIGGLNLVNWFGSLFLDINNAQNLLYLNFLNWYFNYVLMVSCVYLLFAVLMWFVNLARRLLGSFDTDRRL